jgi:anion-transporting  ArsA/GET3 family ATPase
MPARKRSPTNAHPDGARKRDRSLREPGSVLHERLRGRRICICAGAGGVGKTTIAAALGMGLANQGQRVLVLTIDPARRLAGALGLSEPGDAARTPTGDPMRVDPKRFAASGVSIRGELWAMTLDVKSTFDRLIAEASPDEGTRQAMLSNRVYEELSAAAAGSQEVAAVAKLFELDRERAFDTVVLDTPPSRHALDFLQAPTRLASFLEGRAMDMFLLASGIRSRPHANAAGMSESKEPGAGEHDAARSPLHPAALLPRLAPKAMASRVVGGGTGLLLTVFARATGVEVVEDLASFFRLLSGLRESLQERASSVEALLRDPATTFLIVTSPDHEPVREAVFLHRSLQGARMSYGALVVNRVHEGGLDGGDVAELRALLEPQLGEPLSGRVLRSVSDFEVLASRDRESLERLSRLLDERSPVSVPELGEDIDDLAGLARVAERLLGKPERDHPGMALSRSRSSSRSSAKRS